jgi:hypothetical protein
MNKIMVLDTETSGFTNYPKEVKDFFKTLSKDEYKAIIDNSEFLQYRPNILQLSYIIYDLSNPESSKIYDKYIFITKEEGNKISKAASNVHGITYENLIKKNQKYLSTIEDSMDELLEDMKVCDKIIGHNIAFDRERIIDEIKRIQSSTIFGFHYDYYKAFLENLSVKDSFYCTMIQTKEFCGIPGKRGNAFKNPKLSEAYRIMFGYEPNEKALHNALIDIILCLRIYMKHVYNRDICGENDIITKYIIDISPYGYQCPNKNVVATIPSETSDRQQDTQINVIPVYKKNFLNRSMECIGLSCIPKNKVAPIEGGRIKHMKSKKIQRNKKYINKKQMTRSRIKYLKINNKAGNNKAGNNKAGNNKAKNNFI